MIIRYLNENTTTITDDDIVKLFFNENEHLNSNYLKSSWLDKHPEIKEYLVNRYSDSTGYRETLYRMLCHIETRPTCAHPDCNNPVMFEPSHRWNRGRNGYPFLRYCSSKCQANDNILKQKRIQTSIKKYGTPNPVQSRAVQDKIKQTNLDKYGVENSYQRKDVIETIRQKNHERSSEAARKREQTNLKKYGVKTFGETDDFKKFYSEHKDEFNNKIYHTKKSNSSFNISHKEEQLYDLLNNNFNVIRQYKDDMYPFACDFYIPELKLYIEYQGTWTHGPHPFDKYSDNDINRLEHMKDKSEFSRFYYNALNVWTKADPAKREQAKSNHLNYLEIYPKYPLEDIPSFIQEHYNEHTTDLQLVIGTSF